LAIGFWTFGVRKNWFFGYWQAKNLRPAMGMERAPGRAQFSKKITFDLRSHRSKKSMQNYVEQFHIDTSGEQRL
jgi:hypothetical protein